MKVGILIGLIIYMLIVILGFGYVIMKKQEHTGLKSGTFTLSNRDLPLPVVACTLALTVLGTIHVLGLFEMSFHLGAVAQWVSFAHVALLIVVCLVTGRIARLIGVNSSPELINMIFGPKVRLMCACVMSGCIFGIVTLETQGFGIILSTITGLPIGVAAVIGTAFGVVYVILAGMKEIAWLNLINTFIMYVGLIVTVIVLGQKLPGGWSAVEHYWLASETPWKLSLWGTPDGTLFFGFALAFVISTVFFYSSSQMLLQPALAARDAQAVKKAMFIAAPLNGLFGVFTIAIGLAAASLPESIQLAGGDVEIIAKIAAPTMLVNYLPPWLVVWLLASFVAAVLSTFAMTVISIATIFTMDIYKNLFKPDLDPEGERRTVRIVIIIAAVYGCILAQFLPQLVHAMNWLFAWMSPVFVLLLFGLFWKRSTQGAAATLTITWIVNCLWSFTPLASAIASTGITWLDAALMNNVYVCVVLGFIIGYITHLSPNAKPGILRGITAEAFAAAQRG